LIEYFFNFKDFNNDKIRTFENIKTIQSFHLSDNCTVNDMGSIQRIKNYCILRNSIIHSLGELKFVEGNLLIEKCNNIQSVENINIGGNLNLKRSEINILKNLKIKGNLIL
jgi:hypothetical protein